MVRPMSFDTFVLSYINSFFFGLFTPRWAGDLTLVAKNENMVMASEAAMKREWMYDDTNKS